MTCSWLQQAQREISEQLPKCFQCLSCFGCPTSTVPIKILVLLLENTPQSPCPPPTALPSPPLPQLYTGWDSREFLQWRPRKPDPSSLCSGTAKQASKTGLVHWMLILRTRSPEWMINKNKFSFSYTAAKANFYYVLSNITDDTIY